jgi:DHA3 family macrolide efflux protein-like MFS transporter
MAFSLEVLRKKNPARLFYGQLISQSCDRMMTVGLIWAFASDFSPRWIPWFLGVSALPHLLLSWHSGPWTSRLGPLRTVIRTDVFRGGLFLVLAALWPELSPGAQLPALFAFSFASNLAGALFNPAIMSLPVFMPEKNLLQQLTALIDSCFSFGNILGPLMSAVLYPLLGLSGLFLFNGLSYLFAAGLESFVVLARPSGPVSGTEPPGRHKSAAEVLRGDGPLAFILGGFLAVNLFLGPLMVFLPLFVKNVYHGRIGALAALETALAAGMVLGGAALSTLTLEARAGTKIAASMTAVAAAYLAFASTGRLWQGEACLFVLGAALATVNVFALNLFQSRPAARDVPTVMSLVNLISVASLPFSMAGVGLLLERAPVRVLALASSALLAAASAAVVSNRKLREL